MKNKGSIKPRLILNRCHQQRVPLKISQQFRSGLRGVAVHSPMKDIKNIIETKISSIKRQDSLQDLNKLPVCTEQIIRCRSISGTDSAFRTRVRFQNSSVPKNLASSDKLGAIKKKQQQQQQQQNLIQNCSQYFVQGLRERSQLWKRNNILQIPINIMLTLFKQYSKKLLEEASLNNKKSLTLEQTISDSRPSDSSLKIQKTKVLTLQSVFSLMFVFTTPQILSYNNQIINITLKYEEGKKQRQSFWKLASLVPIKRLNEQQFTFLLDKAKFLKQSIELKQQTLSQLIQQQQVESQRIVSQMTLIAAYEDKIRQHTDFMKTIEDSQKTIDSFLMAQPNKILQQEAQGYKEQEQQLFDLAFMLEQSTPQEVSSWMAQNIFMPQQSLELTLRSFPMQGTPQKEYFEISVQNIQTFKKSVKTCNDSIISKLQSILQAKCKKIRQFVGTMRRLASYTIGKREYLTEINKKMATISTLAERVFLRIQKQMNETIIKEIPIDIKDLTQLKELTLRMKQIYNEASVFY